MSLALPGAADDRDGVIWLLPMVTTSAYDPITFNHWLWWRVKCLEASGDEFQRLFEDVLKRANPKFVSIRPYGHIGDRKCDGLYFHEGVVFQAYSPDDLRQAPLQAKIEEDLDGAVQHWGDQLREWVFVYNVRRGLPPDIPGTLREQQEKYPGVKIDHLSSDELWEMARGLSLQQRCEILGPPVGYEGMFLLSDADSSEMAARLDKGLLLIVQDVMSPISLASVTEALRPNEAIGPPVFLRASPEGEAWSEAEEYQRVVVGDALVKSRDLNGRVAVFSLAPIPLVIHLGFLLSDRIEAYLFQFDRDRKSWTWDPRLAETADTTIAVHGLPTKPIEEATEVTIRVSLSAQISPQDTQAAAGGTAVEVDVVVAEPDVMWLRSREQLAVLGQVFRSTLKSVGEFAPNCRRIHLFYAGPTGGGITIGQAINPRMNPPVELYEYSRQQEPRYRRAVTLSEASVG
jgi:hypothetical protein